MYNLTNSIQHVSNAHLSQEQRNSVSKAEHYLAKHKIHEICNELLAKIIETRPDKVKEQMIKILKQMKDKKHYFKKSDFQAMFDAYDVFGDKGNGQVAYHSLMQALEQLNIVYAQEDFLNKYPQFKLEKGVKKSDFANIMDTEYKKKLET